jgi:hypothetical protein
VVDAKIAVCSVTDSPILSVGEISWLSGISIHFDGLAITKPVVAELDTGIR